MGPLILHPTSTAQWQALIAEAENSLSVNLSEELESYLVFLLMRFAKNPSLVHSILATDFLQSLEHIKRERNLHLRDVGDKCLLMCGLFPGRARRSRVRISYYVKLGQSAYGSVSEHQSEHHAAHFSELFSLLRYHFVGLMDVLHTIHELQTDQTFLDLLQAEELWSDTQSPHALKVLKEKSSGFMMASPFSPAHHKH